MKKKSARQIAAERIQDQERTRYSWEEYDKKMRLERQDESDAIAQGTLTSKNRPFLDRHAIAGAGGDPEKDEAILQGTYFDGDEYRPNILNEPRPEEQMSRDFTPAWDTTYGGPYERKPNPRPEGVAARDGSFREQFATSMANDLTTIAWLDRERARRGQDKEREDIVRQRASSTNKGRDAARPPSKLSIR